MPRRVKQALKSFLFTPALLASVRRRAGQTSNTSVAKPFFGIVRSAVGGPAVRTRRMIAEFGNSLFAPNIVYAQSGWNAAELHGARAFRNRGIAPLVFNQNGWYYPGWYTGDWKAANAALVEVQRTADLVVYQSTFCRDAGRTLTGFVAHRHEVIYNAVPPRAVLSRAGPQAPGGPTIWLSAVFTPDTEHILTPAIAALRTVRRGCDPRRAPRLLLCGRIDPKTKETAWFRGIERDLSSLVADGACEWLGQYEPRALPELLARADLALHLKYKDPCPNAVIERMMAGLPHVYSNSGGTPELVGSAGIGLDVRDTWDTQVAVDAATLAGAIDEALVRRDELAEAARAESQRFDWGRYVARHREIFDGLIETHGR
jgi:glycosyltransferase involved in cell wall biosynthesis